MKEISTLSSFNDLSSVFLGIPLPDDQIPQYEKAIHRLQKLNLPVYFQKVDTPHITLQYWKKIDRRILDEIKFFGKQIEKKTLSLPLSVKHPNYFGLSPVRTVLFLDVESNGKLEQFVKMLPWEKEQPFYPHLTIAKIQDSQGYTFYESKVNDILKDIEFSFSVDRICLYGAKGEEKQIPFIEWRLSV